MSFVLWIFELLIGIIASAYNFMISMSIVDFQIERINPAVLCKQLEPQVTKAMISQAIAAALSLMLLPQSLPVSVISFVSIVWVQKSRKTRKRMFDPMTFVRDSEDIKMRHGVMSVFNAGVAVWSLIFAVIVLARGGAVV